LDAEGTLIGAADAPLKIVEFSDFQCPACARAHTGIADLLADHPGEVAILYRHFPLTTIHPHAFAAALASECAGEQGRFREYHDQLFARQKSIGSTSWRIYAADAGIADLDAFDQCVMTSRFRSRVLKDRAAGERALVQGTPAFIFQGRMVVGAGAPEEIRKRVREAMANRRTADRRNSTHPNGASR
jgi:protein-disulfide isomerase